ncbi:MAG: hypothetical protein CMG04_00175 [Candidatus Marinimicrobia bacterium]|nr:hypothetical protein [Candidatus Neomarinimicrobiota bacterium]
MVVYWNIIFPYSSGPPSGYANNSPNNQNCTSCHSGVANSGDGSISFSGLPYAYSIGETYEIQLTVNGTNSRGYGFQVGVQSGNSSAGSLNTNNNSTGIEQNGNLIQHSTRGVSGVWIFDWLAPSSDIGEVTISASGLATGGSSGTGGDYTYTFSKTISKLSETLIISGDAGFRIVSTPVSNGTYSVNKFIEGQEVSIDSLTYYFIQTNNFPYANNQKVIRLKIKNGIEEDVSLDIEDDSHRKYFYRSILGNEEIYSFKKSPLVSSSLKHPGSMFNSHGSIYKFSEYSRFNKMRSISKNINIILAIIEEK